MSVLCFNKKKTIYIPQKEDIYCPLNNKTKPNCNLLFIKMRKYCWVIHEVVQLPGSGRIAKDKSLFYFRCTKVGKASQFFKTSGSWTYCVEAVSVNPPVVSTSAEPEVVHLPTQMWSCGIVPSEAKELRSFTWWAANASSKKKQQQIQRTRAACVPTNIYSSVTWSCHHCCCTMWHRPLLQQKDPHCCAKKTHTSSLNTVAKSKKYSALLSLCKAVKALQ